MAKIQPIILAGGSGSRLWPISRETYPKQLLGITGKKSLLQITYERIIKLADINPPVVVVGEDHKFVAKRQLDELDTHIKYSMVIEPLGRDTAAAICGAVEYVRQFLDGSDLLLVLPADHLITNEELFLSAAQESAALAQQNKIVTFGIRPTGPETGYGYIEKGNDDSVLSFKEKPNKLEAHTYVASGNHYWNSGIFSFYIPTFKKQMLIHAPEMYLCMEKAIAYGKLDGGFFRFDPGSMFDVENSSIDYVLMEKTDSASVIPIELDWIDIGSWKALWRTLETDHDGNVCRGDVVAEKTKNSLIIAEKKLVAAVGIEDTVVVETPDAVLVAAMSATQSVRKVVEHLKFSEREEFRNHHTSFRPWGYFTTLESQERFKIKKVTVNPSSGLSLQKHYHRFEHWVVVSGTARITNGKDVFLLHENESTYIPAGVKHRLENPGNIPLEIIEIQIGSYLGEDDIIHYEDEYYPQIRTKDD